MQANSTFVMNRNRLTRIKKTALEGCSKYSMTAIIFMFFSFSFIGWLWETVLMLFLCGTLVNRGVLHGFWLPIYGFGGILFLVLLNRFRQKPLLVLILGMVVSGIIEYATSWVLETFLHASWWDYSHSFINLNGRISLEGLLFFGAAGCLVLYFLAPLFNKLPGKIPRKLQIVLCTGLILLFVIDVCFSLVHPNMGTGITC